MRFQIKPSTESRQCNPAGFGEIIEAPNMWLAVQAARAHMLPGKEAGYVSEGGEKLASLVLYQPTLDGPQASVPTHIIEIRSLT